MIDVEGLDDEHAPTAYAKPRQTQLSVVFSRRHGTEDSLICKDLYSCFPDLAPVGLPCPNVGEEV